MTENKKDIHIVFQVINFIHESISKQYKLLPIDKLLLITLASHKGAKGIFPMQETLADELGITRRHLRGRIKYLESVGLIWIEKIGRKHHYHLQKLSTIGELQCLYEEPIGEPQCLSQGNHSASHRGTVVATNNKVSNKIKKVERARKKPAPLSADFSPTEKTRAIIDGMGYSADEKEIIFGDFMDHYLDSDIISNAWNKKIIKWFNNEKREPGFLGGHKSNGNGSVKSHPIDPVSETYVRTEENVRTAKEALANILGNLKGGKPNGFLGAYTGNDRVDKKGT